uniref:Glutathione S-transferase kappa 1 n=1 Tax=Rousettus aegyptiacus TaxID=9407 RepID=A0A7J8D690_ROUAE|nr:glutathione S-transferase kappa 1 [Rousettus aegyptiacus]
MAGIMKDSGNESLVWLPRKAIYLRNDIRLLGQHMQVPIEVPEDFSVILEKGSLLAMRFLTAVNLEQPDMLERVSRELWMCNWSRMRNEDITKHESILAVSVLPAPAPLGGNLRTLGIWRWREHSVLTGWKRSLLLKEKRCLCLRTNY